MQTISWMRISGLAAAATLAIAGPAMAGGTISGKVKFEGAAPKRATLDMAADPVCAAAHSAPVLAENIVVTDGALQFAFIYLKTVSGTHPAPSEPSIIDQKGCQYLPHVVGIQVGQPMKFLNNDQTLHNVHGMPKLSPQFNFAMPKFVKQKETKFDAEEVMVAVKCDVHPWMSGSIGVLTHPFYAVSAADGSFAIKNVPAGDYDVVVWQEKLGTKEAKVTVAEGGTATLDFSYAG